FLLLRRPPHSTLSPYTPLFRSHEQVRIRVSVEIGTCSDAPTKRPRRCRRHWNRDRRGRRRACRSTAEHVGSPLVARQSMAGVGRSEEHTSELQSPDHLVCRLLL